jgi:hypothetical protein
MMITRGGAAAVRYSIPAPRPQHARRSSEPSHFKLYRIAAYLKLMG